MEYDRTFFSDYDLANYNEYYRKGNKLYIDGIGYYIHSATKDGFWLLVTREEQNEG